MNTYHYDGTFDGFLSAVFVAWHDDGPLFAVGPVTASLLGVTVEVRTDEARAERLRRGLVRAGGTETLARVQHAFYSETPGLDGWLFTYLKILFARGQEAADSPLGTAGPAVGQAARKTGREVHRMHAFVRFAEGVDGSYRATIEPECNVLPLVGAHFAERYGSIRWIIVDRRRRYALLHDRGHLHLVGAPEEDVEAAEGETRWQQLWRAYYHAVDIPERRNLALRARHMPRRYWRHLTELAG